jgi:hypothetical protein
MRQSWKLTGLALGLALTLLGPAVVAQEGRVPGSIKQAYGEADKFGTEATPEAAATGEPAAAEAPEGGEEEGSLWLDKIHAIGIGGGALLLANLVLGLTLYVGARRKRLPMPARKRRRKWHYTVGLVALALGVLHGILRYVQAEGFDLGNLPAFAVGCAAVLVAASGMLRAWPPRKLARYPKLWIWTHRGLVGAAVLLLALHVTQQAMEYFGHGGG